MEKREISQEVYEKIRKDIPEAIIQMLPDRPENLRKYAKRVKEVQFSKGIPDEVKQKMIAHRLSDEEYLKTFYDVMAITFYQKKPVDKPKMTIVAAQTGSGKSNLTAKLLRENNNCIFVDSDKYKHFRYDAQEIASKEQVLYPFLTGPDAYDHADNIYQYAREHRYNIIKESAPSMTKGLFGKDSEDLLKNGYQIQVHVLAVGKLNSALSVHERYELQIIHGLKTAKLTDRKRHDESYEALEENIRQIQDRFEVQVYTRGRKENNFESIRIYPDKKYASAVDAIAAARKEDNQITVSELGERYQLIQRQMDARNAPKEQKEQLINLCEGEKNEK